MVALFGASQENSCQEGIRYVDMSKAYCGRVQDKARKALTVAGLTLTGGQRDRRSIE